MLSCKFVAISCGIFREPTHGVGVCVYGVIDYILMFNTSTAFMHVITVSLSTE